LEEEYKNLFRTCDYNNDGDDDDDEAGDND
jgi:hypothetical protein